jgi:hypothetical protein
MDRDAIHVIYLIVKIKSTKNISIVLNESKPVTKYPVRDSRHSAVDPTPKDFSAGVQFLPHFFRSIGASLN